MFRSPATFKMELFVTVVNDWKQLLIVTKSSILDVIWVQGLLLFFSGVGHICSVNVPDVQPSILTSESERKRTSFSKSGRNYERKVN